MTIFPIAGKNERLGKLFKTPKHLLRKDGLPAIERSVMYMNELGPYLIVCSAHNDEGLGDFNRIVCAQTKNVIETIQYGIRGSYQQELYIVDCDVIPMKLNKPKGNTVYLFNNVDAVEHYSNFEIKDDSVVSCNEKKSVTNWAGAGVYYFESVGTFLRYSNYCETVSDVIRKMIVNNCKVHADTTSEIFRFGTLYDITGYH